MKLKIVLKKQPKSQPEKMDSIMQKIKALEKIPKTRFVNSNQKSNKC